MSGFDDSGVGVLVPGVAAPSSLTCVRSLGRRGIPVVVGSDEPHTPAASSRYCGEFVRLPDPSERIGAYAEALLSQARRRDVATIVPVREGDVYALSRHRRAFEEEISVPVPAFDTLRRVQDRVELFEAAEAAGVPAPETRPATEWDDWDREVIVKPRYTVAAPAYLGPDADGATPGSTAYREPGERPDLDALRQQRGHVPLVQEFVDDTDEYAFFALYDEGEPVATFQHRQRRGYKYAGGASAFREATDIPELDAAGRALLSELDWHGLAMVEFLRDPETGAFELMEVNPRFWSSLPFSVQAGVDFPLYYWRLARDEPIRSVPDYEVGAAGHLLRGELCYLHSVLTEENPLVERPSMIAAVRDVVGSLVRHPRFDCPALDDPKPFLADLAQIVRSGEDGGPEEIDGVSAGQPTAAETDLPSQVGDFSAGGDPSADGGPSTDDAPPAVDTGLD